jgi:hypothetical protein
MSIYEDRQRYLCNLTSLLQKFGLPVKFLLFNEDKEVQGFMDGGSFGLKLYPDLSFGQNSDKMIFWLNGQKDELGLVERFSRFFGDPTRDADDDRLLPTYPVFRYRTIGDTTDKDHKARVYYLWNRNEFDAFIPHLYGQAIDFRYNYFYNLFELRSLFIKAGLPTSWLEKVEQRGNTFRKAEIVTFTSHEDKIKRQVEAAKNPAKIWVGGKLGDLPFFLDIGAPDCNTDFDSIKLYFPEDDGVRFIEAFSLVFNLDLPFISYQHHGHPGTFYEWQRAKADWQMLETYFDDKDLFNRLSAQEIAAKLKKLG